MVTTTTVFKREILTASELDEINAKIDSMASVGKTDGTRELTLDPVQPESVATAIRTWTDNAAAEEWMAFMRTYNHLISIEITG